MKRLLTAFLSLALASPASAAFEFGWGNQFLDLPAQNGTYLDSSGNGNNASVPGANPPVYTANVWNTCGAWAYNPATPTSPIIGATGSFGATTFNFAQPLSEVTYVFLVDLNPSTPTTGSAPYMLVGGAWSGVNQFGIASVARQIYWENAGNTAHNTWATVLSTTQPHLIAVSMSQLTQEIALSIDGGAWSVVSITSTLNASAPSDVSLELFGSGATTIGGQTPQSWWGNGYRTRIFSEALHNPARAARWTAVKAQFTSECGIP